ncbi:formyltetrahydrofolate deformylase [Amycolatopsis sulphurea]|uniref:Formyltetrahydrofolate deformylase n=1 Tax=Amycolatopsis sulphurea TaxID=76022 RepID=A0A2A9G405_9PSEU|nr:formyltetrahydrofolate deformylase [Amycolatopsis sulphurea]PFG57369.1 formyltetrahydrofolate deformylase [Amycolatopsis sulphurea]
MKRHFTLVLQCPERAGLVHAVTRFLAGYGCDIVEHQQFDDDVHGELFLRTEFTAGAGLTADQLNRAFTPVAADFGMRFRFCAPTPDRILVMVSKAGHCLNDLLFRWRAGSLGGDIALVVSNHEDLRPMAEAAGVPFAYVPVTPDGKAEAEQRLLDLAGEYRVDLVVLARYMQVLSEGLCQKLQGRAINIHHSFLPGFKGAKPYHQAYDRGVKYVGATAHYVTAELDEGPIIEQEVQRVDHSHSPRSLATVGRDAEALALSRAVRWHCQRRVLLAGTRTVVFR